MSESLWLYRVRHSLDPEKRISLSVGDLEGNIFVVNVVMGLMEIAAVTVLMFNLDRLRIISPKFDNQHDFSRGSHIRVSLLFIG